MFGNSCTHVFWEWEAINEFHRVGDSWSVLSAFSSEINGLSSVLLEKCIPWILAVLQYQSSTSTICEMPSVPALCGWRCQRIVCRALSICLPNLALTFILHTGKSRPQLWCFQLVLTSLISLGVDPSYSRAGCVPSAQNLSFPTACLYLTFADRH